MLWPLQRRFVRRAPFGLYRWWVNTFCPGTLHRHHLEVFEDDQGLLAIRCKRCQESWSSGVKL